MRDHTGTRYTDKPWRDMTESERLVLYDRHNGDSRRSDNPAKRLYGTCGCQYCAEMRKLWIEGDNPQTQEHTTFIAPTHSGKTYMYQQQKGQTMSSINVCDCCSSLVKGRALGLVQVVTAPSNVEKSETITKEICPGCVGRIVSAIEAEVEQEQNAYKEPWQREQEINDEVEKATAEQLAAALFEKLMKEQSAKSKAIEGSAK